MEENLTLKELLIGGLLIGGGLWICIYGTIYLEMWMVGVPV